MFRGTSTALITPFTKDNKVDEDGLRRLVDFQEENGIKTVVPCGSTGESAMLSHEEHIRVIEIVVDQVKKAKVVAGAGSNSTSEAIMLSRCAEDIGVDGLLSISPYYVKPTQEGIYQHYKKIAESVNIPTIVYNIPGKAEIEIYTATQKWVSTPINVTQFGTTEILADRLLEDKKGPVQIYFYPEMGAIRQIIQ
jgi:4-hydroxy-tetrahydrodipicolinate synthase